MSFKLQNDLQKKFKIDKNNRSIYLEKLFEKNKSNKQERQDIHQENPSSTIIENENIHQIFQISQSNDEKTQKNQQLVQTKQINVKNNHQAQNRSFILLSKVIENKIARANKKRQAISEKSLEHQKTKRQIDNKDYSEQKLKLIIDPNNQSQKQKLQKFRNTPIKELDPKYWFLKKIAKNTDDILDLQFVVNKLKQIRRNFQYTYFALHINRLNLIYKYLQCPQKIKASKPYGLNKIWVVNLQDNHKNKMNKYAKIKSLKKQEKSKRIKTIKQALRKRKMNNQVINTKKQQLNEIQCYEQQNIDNEQQNKSTQKTKLDVKNYLKKLIRQMNDKKKEQKQEIQIDKKKINEFNRFY